MKKLHVDNPRLNQLVQKQNRYSDILFMFHVHVGNKDEAIKSLKQHLAMLQNRPHMQTIFPGDSIDASSFSSNKTAVTENDTPPYDLNQTNVLAKQCVWR